jgi:TetR/AcrR family transcriptional regulator, transcriptional repressor for nem operon
MRYKSGYKEAKRKELLEISGRIAKSQGFANTGVDGFMKAADMTSGAFYSHFSSKQELFKALIVSELENSIQLWQSNPHDEPKAWIEFEIQRYLNLEHVNRVERGCVLPALASEVARSSREIKQCYEQELLRGHGLFAKVLADPDQAWALLCQMVGTILLARSIADENLKLNIINSSKHMLFKMLDIAHS